MTANDATFATSASDSKDRDTALRGSRRTIGRDSLAGRPKALVAEYGFPLGQTFGCEHCASHADPQIVAGHGLPIERRMGSRDGRRWVEMACRCRAQLSAAVTER